MIGLRRDSFFSIKMMIAFPKFLGMFFVSFFIGFYSPVIELLSLSKVIFRFADPFDLFFFEQLEWDSWHD